MPDKPRPDRRPSPLSLFGIAVSAAMVGFILTLSFGFADHDPAPHGVRIAVAAPARLTEGLADGLAHAAPGSFTVVPEGSAQTAVASVRAQSAAGAFVAGATGPVTIVTAGAAGVSQQQAIKTALTAAATLLHRPARSLDVAPLPPGDRSGLSVFVFELGLLVPSVIGSVGLFLVGRRFRVWWRVGAALLFALLVACGNVLALDTIYGALTGASGALIGVGFFGAFTFVAFAIACRRSPGSRAPAWPRSPSSSSETPCPAGPCRSRSCPTASARSGRGCPTAPSCPLRVRWSTSPTAAWATRCSSSRSGSPGRWPCSSAWTSCT